ncbi:MAG: DHH family phosphoesterase [Ruminococcaceae bacterium]|nr:DHH family phosphoesterase [Oscillospiraceae bacterium]
MDSIPIYKEAGTLSKKTRRLLQPNMLLYFGILLCFAIITALLQQYVLAGVEMGIWVGFMVLYLVSRANRRKQLKAFVEKVTDEQSGVEGQRAPFPMVVVRMADGGIIYVNDTFIQLTGFNDTMKERNIADMLPSFDTQWLISGKTEYPYDVRLMGHRYRVYGAPIQAGDPQDTQLAVLYFADLTELYQIRDEYIRSRPVVSIILVDNYEEMTQNLSEGAMSNLNAKINDAITQWTEGYHGLLRRLERNRYLFIFEKRDLKQAMEDKFSILEDVHAITSPSGLAASISFGLGVEGETFEEGYQFAALAIEMALSRGGDQAVVKDRLNFNFYGGRNKEAEQRSKVRSRVTANSLMELIGQSSRVLIMGHKNADLDSIGAALGIYCMCRKKGKEAHIVMDLQNNMAQEFLEEIRSNPTYTNAFISGQDALLVCDNRSTVVVVDTNRPDQVECKHLLEASPRICVVDHHRRAADYIKPVVVNLHEPYASSASELVTELLQYAVEMNDVLPIEAKALMAGIFLDTKSFNVRTGERTFEAAAFLRQLGADTIEVKRLLQNDFQNTMEKFQIIKSARLYRNEIAIAALSEPTSRVLASQAADELLDISGITASFVLYPDGEQVLVSARSIGQTNVQVILEELGGGGNTAIAGAQITGSTVKEVLDRLVASIDKFYEE